MVTVRGDSPASVSRSSNWAMMPDVTMTLGEGEPTAGPWQVVRLAQLLRMLSPGDGLPAGRPWILAVDGRSGSGKTTLAERLAGVAPASTVVHTDDVAWNHSFFDWTDLLIAGVLDPIHSGRPVSFRPPGWQERNRAGAIEVAPGCELMIVEGVGAARRELTGLLDAAVWIQSDMAEAERRGIERDGGDDAAVSFWHRWMAEELPFIARQRPWTRSEVIVAGTPRLPHDPASEVVIAARRAGRCPPSARRQPPGLCR
jgi:energy-coupling factor transporter ATP-binding protein EcfA2